MLPFLDIETTGLDTNLHDILEVGIVVMSDDLKDVLMEKSWVLPFDPQAGVDDFIKNMHGENGLLKECHQKFDGNNSYDTSFAIVESIYLSLQLAVGNTKPPLCGSSVHFDRKFCESQLSAKRWVSGELVLQYHPMQLFSYRNVDVSSIKELCQRWAPDVYEKRPQGQKKHRALPDCWDTINELRYYREHFLKG